MSVDLPSVTMSSFTSAFGAKADIPPAPTNVRYWG
jgi:hypothetical protein